MPEETRAALDHARTTRERARKFVGVPDSWEGWVMRVMTIAVVLMTIVSLVLLQMVVGLRAYIEDSRHQRTAFQHEETARQCQLLRGQGISQADLEALKC